MKKQGAVVRWDDAKGFGFIHSPQSSAQLFFHIRDWRGSAAPALKQRVSFEEIHVGSKGPRAMDVRPDNERAAMPARPRTAAARPPTQNRHQPQRTQPSRRAAPSRQASPAWPAHLLMLLWAGLLIGGVVLGRLSGWFLPAAFVLNLLTFYAYWQDKHAATQGQWRTAEDTLHVLGLLGGWPGAWFAHQILRHKSTKQAFRQVYWMTAILNVTALGAWVLLPWMPLPH
ncbi:cold shock and DUF1294 domain-containing protein [Hydrogenophaga sp. SL48]|uniref:cold shock and DUF1294 domain-containing protein n=1 Tax=Hydrogenophaga sp. SL48 TaxID=2806347 RepID=UPI001F44F8DD|nr:cold shock and DUF1294 domain-containing protein [Hydrogenophaga sp. SL48]UJW82820.1 cold shock and DUF1294 domain-containing protein [Hydrogenophaga sp. SL48]